tara:strand:- start:669 stop:782 length:114 start_codon:yes stop_codon:yes gene_type:complete
MSKELIYNPIKITSSPTFVGFFVCGMMGRFGYEKYSS